MLQSKILARFFFFFFFLNTPILLLASECQISLDQHIFDANFGWWNRGLENTVVVFTAENDASFKVKGLYKRSTDGRYRYLRNYFFEMPTFEGNNETQFIKKVRIESGEGSCRIIFVGVKSSDGLLEENHARIEVGKNGFLVKWSESEDFLKISPILQSAIVEECLNDSWLDNP